MLKKAELLALGAAALVGVGCAAFPATASNTGAGLPPDLEALLQQREGWRHRCEVDRFIDRRVCTVKTSFYDPRGRGYASLTTVDGGNSWFISASATPIVFVLRVDAHPAISGNCRGVASSCNINGEDARMLTEQLLTGRTMAVRITMVRGDIDRDVAVSGLSAAMNATRAP